MANSQVEEVELATRLTMKDLCCDPTEVRKLPEGQKLRLCLMYGTVGRIGFREDKNTGRDSTYFVGQFEGVNLQTGESLQSAKLYLPEGASTALEARVMEVQAKRGKSTLVQFTFEIRAVRSSKAKQGYIYETAALLKPEVLDPLSGLREIADAARKSIKKSAQRVAPVAPIKPVSNNP